MQKINIDYKGILDYLANNQEIPYSNPEAPGLSQDEKAKLLKVKEKGQAASAEMKKIAARCEELFGLDKCLPIVWLDGSKTKTKKYLWAQMKYKDYVDNPTSVSLFVENNNGVTRYRISLEIKNDGTDKKTMATYHSHLNIPKEDGMVYVSGSNEWGNPVVINDNVDEIKKKIASGDIRKVQLCIYVESSDDKTNKEYDADIMAAVKKIIPYYEHVIGKESNIEVVSKVTYGPSLSEYDPCITKEKWLKLLNDSDVTVAENLRMFKMMLELGGESTCANLAETYGGLTGSYNSWGRIFGERVHRKTNCSLFVDGNCQRYYTIPFVGRYVIEKGKKRYSWKLRTELKEALKEMDLSHIDITTEEVSNITFDKNMILYGPPGTGKTYSTAIYAVAICDKLDIDSVKEMDYDKVMIRYRELLLAGRIAFTTFHQSYGYEEFIEGIKPIVDKEKKDIGYTIEPGVFKKFCVTANKKAKIADNDMPDVSNASVWCVLLDGTGVSDLKKRCFEEGTIRIGYGNYPETITSDTDGLNDKTRRILLHFQTKMNIGDIVVAERSNKTIDGIGVVIGDYEYDKTDGKWPRKRNVKWLMTGIEIDITDLNAGINLDSNPVYPLNRISADKVLELVNANKKVVVDTEIKPYVFIIDEINRGNISKIFGELITLIEDTKREGMDEQASVVLPYSGEIFSVPSNVYILGTMNTADRSIALIDTALRRRFQFVEMMPDADVLRKIGADKVDDLDVALMLEKINERITFLYDREHTIGHAFFTKLKKKPTVETLQSIFEKSVIPLLQEYFYEDYQNIQLVLGDNGKTDPSTKFILDEEVKVKEIFKGNADDVVDLPEKKYTINKEAFGNLESYKQII